MESRRYRESKVGLRRAIEGREGWVIKREACHRLAEIGFCSSSLVSSYAGDARRRLSVC
jgi:hypothetical protein